MDRDPDDPRYDIEKLREAANVYDEPVPTHECASCRDYVKHVESSPTTDYQWCPNCESVTRFERLDSYDRLR